jgi:hypothetical protein
VPELLAESVMSMSTRHEPRYRGAEVLFTSGIWRPVEIVAWARCQAGWAALVRWPDGHEDWLVHAPHSIRPV